nr:DUF1566 domain-containing protein [bacterium]
YDDGPCICSSKDRFCHEYKGLNWSELSFTQNWTEASSYCKQIKGRLPTISELRMLIKNNPATETGGDCGVTDDCLSEKECLSGYDDCRGGNWDDKPHSYFGDRHDMWSSSEESDDKSLVWYVNFYGATIYTSVKTNELNFRCVGE